MMITAVFITALAAAPQQRDSADFVKAFVTAINSKSDARRLALQHPKDRACDAPQFVSDIIARQKQHVIPERYKWKITRIEKNPFEGMLRFAVWPTHQLQIDFERAQFSFAMILVNLVKDASGWHEVLGCPTAEFQARMKTAASENTTRRQELLRRIVAIPRNVRDSVLALDAVGLNISAAKYYAAVEKTDITIASGVVDSIVDRHRLMYRYTYPYNTDGLKEDHYIVIDTIDGAKQGWYYGTTDDFDRAREGYKPGFYVAAMQKLQLTPTSISFALTIDPANVFTQPVYHTVRNPRDFKATKWSTVRVAGTRSFNGAMAGDSIVIRVDRMSRVFRRVR